MFLGFGIILILVLGGVLFLINSPTITGNVIHSGDVVHVQEMPVNFSITDERIIGINTDTDALKYGKIMRGNYANRDVTIINPFNVAVNVELSFSEGILEFVELPYDNFVLGVGDDRKFGVNILTDADSVLGDYSGVLTVVMKIV